MYNGTPFKTPLPYRMRGGQDNGRMPSDSDESVCSNNSENTDTASTPSTNGEISLVAEFDDLIRIHHKIRGDKIVTERTLLDVLEQVQLLYVDYFQAVDESKRLQGLLDSKIHECSDLEHKLQKARRLIDQEKANTRQAYRERDDLAIQIEQIRDLIFKDKGTSSRFSDDVKNKLSFLHNNNNPQLSAIKEINSTGSILSDFSYSRSEDDLNDSLRGAGNTWKKHRPSTGAVVEPAIKKRRSSGNKVVEIGTSDTVRATTTLTLTKDGPITATSIIESIPKTPGGPESTNVESYPSGPPSNLVLESWARDSPRKREYDFPTKQHSFQQKTIVMPDTCGPCEKRIRFGRVALKCKDCKAICHVECKDNLPVPCIPTMNTPNQRNGSGVIGDYTPTTPPMVPALLIHCINEIELRGLNEVGLYRIPGAERDVKALKEKFLKGRGAPCLNKTDIHVICGTVKDFLRGLNEPITTYTLWKDFTRAVEAPDPIDVLPNLCQIISRLPQPNRDTLAYMILHLQKVTQAKECKMGVNNLARIFSPTIVGYSSEDVDAADLLPETVKATLVMEHLIKIPSDYWSSFINVESTISVCKLQQTPSTDSLLRPTATRGLFATPNRNLSLMKRKQKYFPSPQH